jgi:N-ethylmaleimide reductase
VTAAGTIWTDKAGLQPYDAPLEMTAADLKETREQYVAAARNALAADFDGVELHSANGYLLEQFLHPHTNRRTDEYGGSIEGRIRFVVEVARATAEAIGNQRLGIRLSPHGTFNDLPPYAEVEATYTALARELRGLVYVHLVGNPHESFEQTTNAIRGAFGGTLIASGGFDLERAEATLAAKQADLIAFGKPFISNPDLTRRFQTKAPLAAANVDLFYTAGIEGYADYPALG